MSYDVHEDLNSIRHVKNSLIENRGHFDSEYFYTEIMGVVTYLEEAVIKYFNFNEELENYDFNRHEDFIRKNRDNFCHVNCRCVLPRSYDYGETTHTGQKEHMKFLRESYVKVENVYCNCNDPKIYSEKVISREIVDEKGNHPTVYDFFNHPEKYLKSTRDD
jgi:hypothetical protein